MPISAPLLATAGARGIYIEHLRAHGGPVVSWLVTDTVTAFLDTEWTGWNAVRGAWISMAPSADCGFLCDVRQAVTGNPQDVWWVVRELFASEVSTRDVIAHPGFVLYQSGWEHPSAISIADEEAEQESSIPAATRLRMLTGLDAARLAELFGISRVAYQGWIGGVQPAFTRQEHLMQVLAFAEEANERFGSASAVRQWLIAPVSPGGPVPLELLRQRRYDTVRGLLLRVRRGNELVKPVRRQSRKVVSVSEQLQRETLETLNASAEER